MNRKDKEKDILREMFSQLPDKKLPDSFRETMMKQVMKEAVRMKTREERLGLLITILIAFVFLILGGVTLLILEVPRLELKMPDLTNLPFFVYIGTLVFLLLVADNVLRKKFYEKHLK